MNIKTTAIGLLAGSALALCLTTGVVAQTSEVVLQENQASDAGCSLGTVTSLGADFGTFSWDGDSYEPSDPGTSNVVTLQLPLTQNLEPGTIDCVVNVTGSDLEGTDGDGTADTISASAITVSGGTSGTGSLDPTTPVGVTYATGSSGTQGLVLTMDNLADTEHADDYAGTLTIDSAAG